MVKNSILNNAKKAKKDEFYTMLSDIENELIHYEKFFENKTVYCNCDDPSNSNFFIYFENNFLKLKLKKLIVTGFSIENQITQAVLLENIDGEIKRNSAFLFGDEKYNAGDFRSSECIEYLKEADVIVTNPPFSLFREYVSQLMQYNKNFIIIGHQNNISYKEIFPLIKNNKMWLGFGFKGSSGYFYSPYENYAKAGQHKDGLIRVSGVCWFTNIKYNKQYKDLLLKKEYNEIDYPKYDNYDAINVDKVKDIPCDYEGVMGVPITFLDKYNPNQFEILGITDGQDNFGLQTKKYTVNDSLRYSDLNARGVLVIDGNYKKMYARILIRKRKHNKNAEISC